MLKIRLWFSNFHQKFHPWFPSLHHHSIHKTREDSCECATALKVEALWRTINEGHQCSVILFLNEMIWCTSDVCVRYAVLRSPVSWMPMPRSWRQGAKRGAEKTKVLPQGRLDGIGPVWIHCEQLQHWNMCLLRLVHFEILMICFLTLLCHFYCLSPWNGPVQIDANRLKDMRQVAFLLTFCRHAQHRPMGNLAWYFGQVLSITLLQLI